MHVCIHAAVHPTHSLGSQCLQEELSRTIADLLAQFVGEQRTTMEAAFEAARTHASAASALNTDNADRLAEAAGAVSQQLQACISSVAAMEISLNNQCTDHPAVMRWLAGLHHSAANNCFQSCTSFGVSVEAQHWVLC